VKYAGLILACAFAPSLASHAAYPEKPVRLIVPFPPGGSTEPLARALSQRFFETFGQQLIVDNRPGAGATIGAEIVAKDRGRRSSACRFSGRCDPGAGQRAVLSCGPTRAYAVASP